MVSENQVLEALSKIIDPDFQRDIVSLGFVKHLKIEGGTVSFDIELTTPACPLKPVFKQQAIDRVSGISGVDRVEVEMTARKRSRPAVSDEESGLKEVKTILAVSSCKGGVGKSTVAAMLALTLARRGFAVGLLDADLFGPSVPTLFNVHEQGVDVTPERRFSPRTTPEGLKLMSFGFLVGDGPAVMRGPMVSQYVQQLLHRVAWGELDYLIVDMPPGTGDVQLTLAQSARIDAAVIVTTPHQLALTDVRKGILMFDKVNVPVIGVIENMSWFECDGCGKRHRIFGEAGAKALERAFGLEILAEIPLLGASAAGPERLPGPEVADPTTDATMRALGRRSAEETDVPDVSFDAERIVLHWPGRGERLSVPNAKLRRACNCALCVDEMTNRPLLDPKAVPDDVRAENVSIIGNYAVAVDWSDGHNTGFFPYSLMRELAEGT